MRAAAVGGPLLERSHELARITSALTEACSGRGALVVIEGPAGIGKTALLDAARTVAAESGMRVLRSRGTELERDFAFGVVRQLFEPALADASELQRADLLQGAAGRAADLLALPGAPPADAPRGPGVDPSFAILHGLYWLCANLAAAGPLFVVVDDAHWGDAPSLRFLTFLLTRLEELNVALAVATRPREAGTDAALLATLTAARSADVVHLLPLTRTGVAQLLESALGGAPDAAFVDACLRATGGTPFLLRELVGALNEGGIAPYEETASYVERIGARSVGRSINLQLRRLPNHAGRLARALAVLEQSDLTQAARLAQLDEAQATRAAELLGSAGIVEAGRYLTFVHPIVRRSIYDEISRAERAKAHRRAAHVLTEQRGASERVAEHLLVTEPAGDEWAVERLVEAARAARQQGAPESEAVFLRRALAERPLPDHQSKMLLDLGIAEANAGLDGWAEHLQRAVDAAPDVPAAAEAAMVLAHALSRAQRFAEAVEVLDRASFSLDPRYSELAILLETAALVPALNDATTAPSLVVRREALRDRAVGDSAASAELLAALAFCSVLRNEPADVGADLATRALEIGGRATTGESDRPWFSFATWLPRAALTLLWAERYAAVRPLLDALTAQAGKTGDSSQLHIGLANRSWLALRRGDLIAAEEDSRTALASPALSVLPMSRVSNSALLAEALVEQGKLDEAEEVLAPLGAEIERETLMGALLRFARGRLRIEQERAADALDDFLGVGVNLKRAQITCPSYVPWRSEAALAHLALGDREQSRRLAKEELELAQGFGTPRVLGVAKRASGLAAGGKQGELLLWEAVEAFERADAKLGRARTLADLGAMLRRRNRRSEARELLREALDGAHRSGAARLADRAETELRATGARPRRVVLTGLESLTASERRVAELASRDLTNREIAQLLFITDRTVEGHLTSVFRKLRLDSRNELAAALPDRTPVSA